MMSSPYTFSNFPAIRPQRSASAWPSSEEIMEHGRKAFAYWNQPMRPWPAPESVIMDRVGGRLLLERDKKRLKRHRLKLPRLQDKPRILPFKGECVKNWLLRFKAWRNKRSAFRQEDWLLRSSKGKSHPIFE